MLCVTTYDKDFGARNTTDSVQVIARYTDVSGVQLAENNTLLVMTIGSTTTAVPLSQFDIIIEVL